VQHGANLRRAPRSVRSGPGRPRTAREGGRRRSRRGAPPTRPKRRSVSAGSSQSSNLRGGLVRQG
jgi:hypothetical protein